MDDANFDPPQTLEDRVQAQVFMAKHGMKREPDVDGEVYGCVLRSPSHPILHTRSASTTDPSSGVYACSTCLSTTPPERCLIPLLAHLGSKRFRAHPANRAPSAEWTAVWPGR